MTVRIVVAPQGFKGSLDATDVARAIARGLRRVFPDADLDLIPVADGGEGTVRALVNASGGRTVTTRVMGPLQRPVTATWGLLGGDRIAVIEMAAASGLPLIGRQERNPAVTTSYGTGQLIGEALDHGVDRIIVGLGGSATNDGGAGMAQALGVRFLDAAGRELPLGGAALLHLAHIDVAGLDPRLSGVRVEAASDVANPLVGPEGASYIYGPQKGADPEMVRLLDAALTRYAEVVALDLGKDVAWIAGSGAAGGLGAALIAFLNATLESGVDLVFRALHLPERLRGASLVFTGEGRMDHQDLYGKAPLAVAQLADRLGVPSVAIVGSTGRDYQVVFQHGLDAVIGTVNRPMTLDRAVAEGPKLIAEAAMRAARLIKVGMEIHRDGPHGGGILT